jgi:hypothetical protein
VNFLRGFVELCGGTEIPQEFALWSGVAGVSCALGRRVWVDMGTYSIYPNFYIVLVAGSGRFRKSTSIGVIENVLRELKPKVNIIAQKITPEGLIDAVRDPLEDTPDRLLCEVCEGFVMADELSTFLNKKSYEAGLAPLLISFYDCKAMFEYRTKGRGLETVSNACLGLLGASTIDWIRNAIPSDAVGGGLTSRMLFIFVEVPPAPVAITSFSSEKRALRHALTKELQRVQTLAGEAKMTPAASEFFTFEYERFYRESSMYDNAALSGYASRRHVHLLKVALVLSACDGNSLEIDVKHLEGAKKLLEEGGCEAGLPRVMRLVMMSAKGSVGDQILTLITRHGRVARSEIIQRFSHICDGRELTEILSTLSSAGMVRAMSDGAIVVYELVKKKL